MDGTPSPTQLTLDLGIPAQTPPDELVREWIAKHQRVFVVVHGGITYYVRAITRREYRIALLDDDLAQRDDDVAELCVLWPRNWRPDPNGPAGLPHVLTEKILELSGCSRLAENFAKTAEFVATDLEAQMETVIDHVFCGGGNFDRYKDWTHQQLIEAYHRARWMLEQKGVLVQGQGQAQGKPPRRAPRHQGTPTTPPPEPAERPASLDQSIDEYTGGPAGLQNMGEFARKNQKMRMREAIRKSTR